VLEVVVDNRVRLCADGMEPELVSALKEAFEHPNPAFELRRAIGVPTWGEPRTIRTWHMEHEFTDGARRLMLTLPRGGLQRVRDALAEHGVDWREVDDREPGLPADIPDHLVKLHGFQGDLMHAAMEKQNCILRSSTGSGKTVIAFGLAAALKLPTVVVVSKRALFDQWIRRAHSELGLRPGQVGQIRGGAWRVGDLTVAMQKTLALAFERADPRALKLADETGVLIADEVHLFAAKSFIQAIDPFRAKYRVGVSDDHRRKDKKEFLVHDVFGVVAAEVGRKALVEAGFILDVEVRVVPTAFEAPWYGMPTGDEDPKELDFDRLLKEMAADDARTKLALDVAQREVEAGEQVLLMTHQRDLCRKLDQALAHRDVRTGFLVGDAPAEFERTVRDLAKGKVRAAVGTYQAMGTGLDLPRVAVGIAVTPIAGNQQFVSQVCGRLCRTSDGKKAARLYYLLDPVYGDRHLRNLVKWNRKVVVWRGGKWVDAAKVLRPGRAA